MLPMETKTADIIKALGGASAVARKCNISRQAVRAWKVRDEIPPARLQLFQEIRPDIFNHLTAVRPEP
jgi:hypothetical protein